MNKKIEEGKNVEWIKCDNNRAFKHLNAYSLNESEAMGYI